MKYSGFWKRAAALLVDYTILTILAIPAALLTGMTLEALAINPNYAGPLPFLVNVAIFLLYFSIMESSKYQGTLGKMLLLIKVVDKQGCRQTFKKAFLRNLSKFVSIIPFFGGFMVAAFTPKKQALHDILTSSFLIDNY
ncbi:putative RDD family membrane protein YckC [Elusimicrobium posterum]|uniref:RDD family protein n=1 Tax=Elusimicrobium posterum TaxID=3116653 RepID=UPI003C71CB88